MKKKAENLETGCETVKNQRQQKVVCVLSTKRAERQGRRQKKKKNKEKYLKKTRRN